MTPNTNCPKSLGCFEPNRDGLYVLERHEEFADLWMSAMPTSDALRAELDRIGEAA